MEETSVMHQIKPSENTNIHDRLEVKDIPKGTSRVIINNESSSENELDGSDNEIGLGDLFDIFSGTHENKLNKEIKPIYHIQVVGPTQQPKRNTSKDYKSEKTQGVGQWISRVESEKHKPQNVSWHKRLKEYVESNPNTLSIINKTLPITKVKKVRSKGRKKRYDLCPIKDKIRYTPFYDSMISSLFNFMNQNIENFRSPFFVRNPSDAVRLSNYVRKYMQELKFVEFKPIEFNKHVKEQLSYMVSLHKDTFILPRINYEPTFTHNITSLFNQESRENLKVHTHTLTVKLVTGKRWSEIQETIDQMTPVERGRVKLRKRTVIDTAVNKAYFRPLTFRSLLEIFLKYKDYKRVYYWFEGCKARKQADRKWNVMHMLCELKVLPSMKRTLIPYIDQLSTLSVMKSKSKYSLTVKNISVNELTGLISIFDNITNNNKLDILVEPIETDKDAHNNKHTKKSRKRKRKHKHKRKRKHKHTHVSENNNINTEPTSSITNDIEEEEEPIDRKFKKRKLNNSELTPFQLFTQQFCREVTNRVPNEETDHKQEEISENSNKQEEISENSNKQEEISENSNKQEEISENSNKQEEISENSNKQEEISENNIKQEEISENNIKQEEISENNIKQEEISENNIKQEEISENNIKQEEISENNIKQEEVEIQEEKEEKEEN